MVTNSIFFKVISRLSLVVSSTIILASCQVAPQTPSTAAAVAASTAQSSVATIPGEDAEPALQQDNAVSQPAEVPRPAVNRDDPNEEPSEPIAQAGTADETRPQTDKSSVEQPGVEQPGVEQPGVEQPGVEQPGVEQPSVEQPGVEQPGVEQPGVEQPDDLWERIRQDLSWQQTDSVRIDKARENYLRQSNYLPMMSERADQYLYYIVEEVQKRNMPMEIALIPMIESTLDPFARGPSGAAGLWQIMPKTGAHLGLEQDSWYDGRQAVRESTKVALDYLESLYYEFDEDWFLALAAYNAGSGRVSRAQEANKAKGLDTDYWSLKLPRHTTNYVPKVIALAQIVAEPERFEVTFPQVENAPSFEAVDTGTHLELAKAAELAEIDLETLRALNAGQLGETISPGRPFEILVPIDSVDIFEYNISQLSPEELVQWKTYKIKPGDSLGRIAQKFDIEVEVLQDINRIRGSTIQAGDILKIPGAGDSGLTRSHTSSEDPAFKGYRVREGDSLYGIAGRFKVSVDEIIAWNALDGRAFLKPGQQLKLYPKGG